jgi:hypothetical protein
VAGEAVSGAEDDGLGGRVGGNDHQAVVERDVGISFPIDCERLWKPSHASAVGWQRQWNEAPADVVADTEEPFDPERAVRRDEEVVDIVSHDRIGLRHLKDPRSVIPEHACLRRDPEEPLFILRESVDDDDAQAEPLAEVLCRVAGPVGYRFGRSTYPALQRTDGGRRWALAAKPRPGETTPYEGAHEG